MKLSFKKRCRSLDCIRELAAAIQCRGIWSIDRDTRHSGAAGRAQPGQGIRRPLAGSVAQRL